jgi:replicative DNA helicase
MENVLSLKEAVKIGLLRTIGREKIHLPTLELGKAIGNIQEDDFIVVTARGGTGKTFLMLQMAFNLAEQNIPVAFFSGEMSVGDLAESRLKFLFPETRNLTDEDLPSKKVEQVEKVKDLPLYFPEIGKRWTFRNQCIPFMEKMRKEHGIRAFFFDHLRYFYNEDPAIARKEERLLIEQTVMDMRLYAKQNKCPIILAVQPKQMDSDIEASIDTMKGSSAISQEATNVIVLDRVRVKKKDNPEAQNVYEPYIHIKVEKARHGQGNTKIKAFLHVKECRFVQWEKGGSELYNKFRTLD